MIDPASQTELPDPGLASADRCYDTITTNVATQCDGKGKQRQPLKEMRECRENQTTAMPRHQNASED